MIHYLRSYHNSKVHLIFMIALNIIVITNYFTIIISYFKTAILDASTISRDIQYLIAQLQNYLNSLAKETFPFMYQTSIEGIKNVLKECWSIYTLGSNNKDNDINHFGFSGFLFM
jgi:hypothetical protein